MWENVGILKIFSMILECGKNVGKIFPTMNVGKSDLPAVGPAVAPSQLAGL
jgi:hypothetical protein